MRSIGGESLPKALAAASSLGAGQSWSAVACVARVTTSSRSSGGKAPGPAGAGGVLQAGQAALGEALAPQADGVAVAVEFLGDGLVGGAVGVGGPQDQTAAESECLGGGSGAGQGSQLRAGLVGQVETGAERTWHESLL